MQSPTRKNIHNTDQLKKKKMLQTIVSKLHAILNINYQFWQNLILQSLKHNNE